MDRGGGSAKHTMNYVKSDKFLKEHNSYWIYASNGKHYLGRYQGRGDWEFLTEKLPGRKRWDCSPPDDVRFIAYREVDDNAFAPFRIRL